MIELMKSVFKGSSVKVYKHVQKAEGKKIKYVVDTYLDDMYICIPDNNMVLSRVYNADDLKRKIENDSANEYNFTTEAYYRCKDYFSAIAL